MIKLFLTVGKYLIKSGKVAGSLSVLVVATWGVFSWVDSRQDKEADRDEIMYEQVIPRLEYLISADSASKARDAIILSKIDSLGEQVEENTRQATAVTSSYTTWVKNHVVTIDEFTEYMGPWIEDVNTLKKKTALNPGRISTDSMAIRYLKSFTPDLKLVNTLTTSRR